MSRSLEEAVGLEEVATQGRSLEEAVGLEEPSFLQHAIRGATNIPSAIASGLTSLGQAAVTPPDPLQSMLSRLAQVGRGAVSGATAGILPVEEPTTEAEVAQQTLGRALGVVTPFGLISKGAQAIGLVPRVARTVAGGILGAAEPISRGEPGEALERGITGAGAVRAIEAVPQIGRATGRFLTRPARPILEAEAQEVANLATNRMTRFKLGFAEQQIELVNKKAIDDWVASLASRSARAQENAQAAKASYEASKNAYDQIITQRKLISNSIKELESRIAQPGPGGKVVSPLAEEVRPVTTVAEEYRPINTLTPEELPIINMPSVSITTKNLAERLSASVEGLPTKAGLVTEEKIAVGLEESLGTHGALPKEIRAYFGSSIGKLSPEALDSMARQVGISPTDVAELAKGTLRLDKADRLLKVLGPAAPKSGVARSLFWSIIQDLEQAEHPLAKQLLKARATFRQNIAADELADIASSMGSRTNAMGQLVIKPEAVANELAKNPLFRDSFPIVEQQKILSTLDFIFQTRRLLPGKPKELKPFVEKLAPVKVGKAPVGIARPKPGTLEPEAITPKMRPGLLTQHPFITAHATGLALSPIFGLGVGAIGWTTYLAGALYPRAIFRAASTPRGRIFLRALYATKPPMINDVGRASALAAFLAQEQAIENQ